MRNTFFAALALLVTTSAQAADAQSYPQCRSDETCNWQLVGPDGNVVVRNVSYIGCEKRRQQYYTVIKETRCVQQR